MLESQKVRYGLLMSVGVAFASSQLLSGYPAWLFLFGLWIATGGYWTLYLAYHTLGRDISAFIFFARLVILLKSAEWRNLTVPKMFARTAKRLPQKIMFYMDDQKWTFQDVDEYSNKVANYFLSTGLKKGDVMALFMENRPEYVATWLGLSKIGVVPALINFNLKSSSLIHTIEVACCKGIIYGAERSLDVNTLISNLKDNDAVSFQSYCSGRKYMKENSETVPIIEGTVDLDDELPKSSSLPIAAEISDSINFNDKLMYIYTSGTTGLPKAAIIKHSRYILGSGGAHAVIGVRDDDVVYSPLPLYHSVAGMISLSGCFNYGYTMVLKKRFSATKFWRDCVKYKVTAAQYIGEICRYLLNTPPCLEERQHQVRLMFGNGLRPQIWKEFVKRFNVPNIAEFYGSTEGNSNIINRYNVVGAVGFVPVLFPNVLPLGLIKVNNVTGEPLRDERNGLCIPCRQGEPGEFVGKIVRNHPVRDFEGYAADSEATASKILRNVWRTGDECFRTGDILIMDKFGWLYFKDRAGDTFRWKGENVSTAEVEATLSNMIQLKDAAVYGVEVPGIEGKAGMAAIHDPEGKIDLRQLARSIREQLPAYARPLFVRLVKSIDMTGTFKMQKFNLQKEGFNVSNISELSPDDKLYFLHPATGMYEAMTTDLFQSIINGLIRL